MALCWVLHNEAITTVLIGASRPSQIVENVQALEHLTFTPEEIRTIEDILNTSTEGGTQHD
jgi:L-glyceraldehyde 3-phosphate reductase